MLIFGGDTRSQIDLDLLSRQAKKEKEVALMLVRKSYRRTWGMKPNML